MNWGRSIESPTKENKVLIFLDPGHTWGNKTGTNFTDDNGNIVGENDFTSKYTENLKDALEASEREGTEIIIQNDNGEIWPADKNQSIKASKRTVTIREYINNYLNEHPGEEVDVVVISNHFNWSPKDSQGNLKHGHQIVYKNVGAGKEFAIALESSLDDSTKHFYNEGGVFFPKLYEGPEKAMVNGPSKYTRQIARVQNVYPAIVEFAPLKTDIDKIKQEGPSGFLAQATSDVANGILMFLIKKGATSFLVITPGNDHPDDNHDNSSSIISSFPMVKFKVKAPIGILQNGYYFEATKLLDSLDERYTPVNPSALSPSLAQEMPLLIIPSAGLMGLEGSSFFKAALEGYVSSGGRVLAMAQQQGYEFSALPVPQEPDGTYRYVTGYGWREDQSCFANAVYVDTWHTMLSGQSKSTPSLSVDGYFTDYPTNTEVLLRRTINDQPALITYEYGQGRVIATSMYTFWAYSQGQSSAEEIALNL